MLTCNFYRLNTTETLARESDVKYKSELDTLKVFLCKKKKKKSLTQKSIITRITNREETNNLVQRERDWLNSKLDDLQTSSLENYSNFEEELRECKELCVTLMSQYTNLLSSVAPLPSVIQSMCNDQVIELLSFYVVYFNVLGYRIHKLK